MWCVTVYKQYTGQSKIGLSMRGLIRNSMNILKKLLKFKKDFKYFIYVGGV